MLGEAWQEAEIVSDSYRDLIDVWELRANAAASVGQHYTDLGSPEAAHFLQYSARRAVERDATAVPAGTPCHNAKCKGFGKKGLSAEHAQRPGAKRATARGF